MLLSDQIKEYYNRNDVKEFLIQNLSELISIPSISSTKEDQFVFGKKSAEALQKVMDICLSLNMPVYNHDWYCVSSLLKGNSDEEIGIICHADVVPASDDWTFPPFQLTLKNGILTGRGVLDDKGPLIASLCALRFFIMNDIKLPFSVRLIVGGSEEKGMNDIVHYLEHNKPPRFSFTPDSSFPVCCAEKGICQYNVVFDGLGPDILDFSGGVVTNAVAGKASCLLNYSFEDYQNTDFPDGISIECFNSFLKITSSGKTAHAAMPEDSDNAIVKLARFLLKNNLVSDPSSIKVMNYILQTGVDYLGTGSGVNCHDDITGDLTDIIGLAYFDENDCFVINHNMRYPETVSFNDFIYPKIQACSSSYGAQTVIVEQSNGYSFSPTKPEIVSLCSAYNEVMNKNEKPYATGGGTYARSFPSTVAFGPEFYDSDPIFDNGKGGVHQGDESVRLTDLLKSAEIYTVSLARLAGLI